MWTDGDDLDIKGRMGGGTWDGGVKNSGMRAE